MLQELNFSQYHEARDHSWRRVTGSKSGLEGVIFTLLFIVLVSGGWIFGHDISSCEGVMFAVFLATRNNMQSLGSPLSSNTNNDSFEWLDFLGSPCWVCRKMDGLIVAANTAGLDLLGSPQQLEGGIHVQHILMLDSSQGEPLQMVRNTGIATWDILTQENAKLTAQVHVSQASPSPDELMLIQFFTVTHDEGEGDDLNGSASPTDSLALQSSSSYKSLDSEKMFNTMLAHLPFAVCVTNQGGMNCLYASERLSSMFGLSGMEDQSLPRWWERRVVKEELDKVTSHWNYLKRGDTCETNFRIRRPWGAGRMQEIIIKWISHRDRSEQSDVLFHYFVELEEEGLSLRVEALLREKSAIGRWSWDRKWNMVNWSTEFYRIHDLPFNFQPNLSMPFPYMSEDTQFDLRLLIETLEDRIIPLSTQYKIILPDDTHRDLVMTIADLRKNDQGEVEYLAGLIEDVSTLREMERVQANLMTNLMQKQQTLKEFSSAVSHRLRVPVAQLLGMLGLMLDKIDLPSEQQLSVLHACAEDLDNAVHEMNQLLNVEKLSEGNAKRYLWMEVWRPIAKDLQDRLVDAQACLSVDFSAAKHVFGVKEYLQGIVNELLQNALKFRDFDRPLEIQVTTEIDQELVWLHVQDNGIGMDIRGREEAPFEVYKKFHPSRSGKGLGLHLVKIQMELLRGFVKLSSAPGHGTKVSIGLPVANEVRGNEGLPTLQGI